LSSLLRWLLGYRPPPAPTPARITYYTTRKR
jgi:hypothetical protein